MIGRKNEIETLRYLLQSNRPEFLALYGRRRVGKTFLVKEFFKEQFSFYTTGVPNLNTKKQLKVFSQALTKYGDVNKTVPKDWFEAFSRLENLLSSPDVIRDYESGKRVVFIDELPWMDTARSDFKSALDYFWNSWGSSQKDLLFIVCGSATSWIINNIVQDTGGFYNRVTKQIHLKPFTLGECEQLLASNGVKMTRHEIIESYMVFGGVPYYLNYIKPSLSLAQNIDLLFFRDNSPFRYEFDQLFASLFKHSGNYIEIVKALSKNSTGMTRKDLVGATALEGKDLTKCLTELVQCGFLRKYRNMTSKQNGSFYQLIDPLTLFCLTFVESEKVNSWINFIDTPAYYAWCGLAFEKLCLLHTDQIKQALGISGISSSEYSWRSKTSVPGAQIDMLIDRQDGIIDICEMKYNSTGYRIDAAYEKSLINKQNAFRSETKTKKAVHFIMVTSQGLIHNKYSGIILHEITGEDLFK